MTVQQVEQVPDRWREMAAWVADGVADGLPMRTQVAPRPVGVLQGLQASVNPVAVCPSFQEIAKRARWPRRSRRCATPSAGGASSAEHAAGDGAVSTGSASTLFTGFERLFPMTDPVDYEPDRRAQHRRAGRGPGRRPDRGGDRPADRGRRTQLLYMTLFNYAHGNLDDVREMLLSPNSVIGLSDAGAHCGAISDGSFPTTALSAVDAPRRRACRSN